MAIDVNMWVRLHGFQVNPNIDNDHRHTLVGEQEKNEQHGSSISSSTAVVVS